MKFFSKYSNFRIVLKHGLPGEPMTGRAAVAGVYVKFENGEVTVSSQEIINLMLAHPRFGTDFVADEADPFSKSRKGVEPEHDMVNIEYGHVGKNLNPKPGKQSEVMEIAKNMAKEMAKEMVKEILADMNKDKAPAVEPESAPKVKEPVLNEAKAKK